MKFLMSTRLPEPKACPHCGITAYHDGQLEYLFGYRRMTPGGSLQPQPWCRCCRSSKCRSTAGCDCQTHVSPFSAPKSRLS